MKKFSEEIEGALHVKEQEKVTLSKCPSVVVGPLWNGVSDEPGSLAFLYNVTRL